ncbi:helix-turn-helix domain-containing protein [Crossiella sp. NPDC003009]
MTVTSQQETYLPPVEGRRRVADVRDFLLAHVTVERERPSCFLSGAAPGDRVELPAELYQVLLKVAEALQSGLAVSVSPVSTTLTTQQAAELLGVSRPTVIRLLDGGEIPFERVGSHRRVLLRDLIDYRERRRAAQYAALEATAVDEDEDVEASLLRLRAARREVGRRRRGQA